VHVKNFPIGYQFIICGMNKSGSYAPLAYSYDLPSATCGWIPSGYTKAQITKPHGYVPLTHVYPNANVKLSEYSSLNADSEQYNHTIYILGSTPFTTFTNKASQENVDDKICCDNKPKYEQKLKDITTLFENNVDDIELDVTHILALRIKGKSPNEAILYKPDCPENKTKRGKRKAGEANETPSSPPSKNEDVMVVVKKDDVTIVPDDDVPVIVSTKSSSSASTPKQQQKITKKPKVATTVAEPTTVADTMVYCDLCETIDDKQTLLTDERFKCMHCKNLDFCKSCIASKRHQGKVAKGMFGHTPDHILAFIDSRDQKVNDVQELLSSSS